jgi:glycine/D-amino acid oxidase-like deaminating enzyme
LDATTPLWQDEPHEARPPLDGPRSCEVCVIGGGIGGIATAWRLARRGMSVLVVERRTVASGATGRNGGFFIAGAAPMYNEMREAWGRERAARIYAATLAAQGEMLEAADAAGALGAFSVTGLLRLAMDEEEAPDVRAHRDALAEDGFPGELVEAGELPEPVRREHRLGLLTVHDGSVQPARWVRALARAAEADGAEIAEGTRVTAPPAPDGDGTLVATDGGEVRADRVVIAVDGGLAALAPAAGAVRTKRLNMVATAPAADGLLPLPIYARYGYEYAHQLPDGRVALGGFSDLDGEAAWMDEEVLSEPVQARLDRYLREELRVEAPVTHRWVGLVGYGPDRLPVCGPLPDGGGRVFALGAYSGTGHVQGWVAARIVCELMLEGTSADAGLYEAPGPTRTSAAAARSSSRP